MNSKKKFFILVISVMGIFFCQENFVQAKTDGFPDMKFSFDKEKRSLICTGTGYAYISKKTYEEEGLKRALAAAKRLILRKSNEILQKKFSGDSVELAEIEPGEYVCILSQNKVEPPIKGDNTAYGICIQAEIQYRLTADYDSHKLLSDSNLPLTVRVWSDEQKYKAGKRITFYMRSNSDCFIRMIDVSPGGEMIQLLPNLYRNTNSLKGGKTYRFPDPAMGDDFTLDVGAPFGKETVILFAGKVQTGDISFSKYNGQFGIVKGSEKDISNEVRRIVPKKTGEKAGLSGEFPYVEFFESQWMIETEK